MLAELFFPAPPAARPWVRNSTPTRNARSCCSDGFSTALALFREPIGEFFREVSRRLTLESSRRKQTHFTPRYRRPSSRPPRLQGKPVWPACPQCGGAPSPAR